MNMLDLDAVQKTAAAGRGTDPVVVTRRFLAEVARELGELRSRPPLRLDTIAAAPALDHDAFARAAA